MNTAHPAAGGTGSAPDSASPLLRAIEGRARDHHQAFFAMHAARLPGGEAFVDRAARLEQLQRDPGMDPYDRPAAERWARQDLQDYRRLPAGHVRTDAALQLAENLQRSPRYAQALLELAPTIEREVRQIDRADRQRMERDLVARPPGGRVVPARSATIDDIADRPPGTRVRPLPVRERFDVQWGLTGRVYRFRDTTRAVALEESWRELRTGHDTPAAAKAIVDRAIERGWRNLRVEGSDAFERQVRRVAAERGVGVGGTVRKVEVVIAQSSAAADRGEPRQVASATTALEPHRDGPVLRALALHLNAGSASTETRFKVMTRASQALDHHRRQKQRAVVAVFDSASQTRVQGPPTNREQFRELDRGR